MLIAMSSTPERAKAVLRYFLRHPRAADTLRGIVAFRMLEEDLKQSARETRDAVLWLVGHGYLNATSRPGMGVVFSLNAARGPAVARLVALPASRRIRRTGAGRRSRVTR